MSWVMDDAPVLNTTEMVVLYALADQAKDDGTCAWPSHSTIADKTRCSRRTVIRHINELERRGLITRGDQRHVAHISADRRPVVWNLNIKLTRHNSDSTGCQNVTPVDDGVTSTVARGDSGGIHGVTSSAQRGDTGVTQPILNPSINPSLTHPTADGGKLDQVNDPFKEFWDVYPRKKGDIKQIREKFNELASEHGADVIITGAKHFAEECEYKKTAQTYICYPSTFLNQGRWKSYQSSQVSKSRPSMDEIKSWKATPNVEQEQDSDYRPF